MHNLFEKPLAVIKQWPALGPIASQRLFNNFLSHKSILQDLKKLVDFFEKYETCSLCLAPLMHTDCRNCIALKAQKAILIVPHILDFMLICEDLWALDCAFMVLNGYISPLTQKSFDSIGLKKSLQYIEMNHMPVHTLFNRSLEARGTLWLIKGLLTPATPIYDQSDLLGPKEALFVLSSQEIAQYKRQLESHFSS